MQPLLTAAALASDDVSLRRESNVMTGMSGSSIALCGFPDAIVRSEKLN